MHLDGYGIAPGCHADFVLLHAKDAVEAIRLSATRLKVYGWRQAAGAVTGAGGGVAGGSDAGGG